MLLYSDISHHFSLAVNSTPVSLPLVNMTVPVMLLYLLASIIVTASSSVIYMYGYQKFMAFISQEREKQARDGEMRLGTFDGLDKLLYDL